MHSRFETGRLCFVVGNGQAVQVALVGTRPCQTRRCRQRALTAAITSRCFTVQLHGAVVLLRRHMCRAAVPLLRDFFSVCYSFFPSSRSRSEPSSPFLVVFHHACHANNACALSPIDRTVRRGHGRTSFDKDRPSVVGSTRTDDGTHTAVHVVETHCLLTQGALLRH